MADKKTVSETSKEPDIGPEINFKPKKELNVPKKNLPTMLNQISDASEMKDNTMRDDEASAFEGDDSQNEGSRSALIGKSALSSGQEPRKKKTVKFNPDPDIQELGNYKPSSNLGGFSDITEKTEKDDLDDDVDNDGDTDDSDRYLKKRRATVAKAIKKQNGDK